jgi:hypothetical protein
MDAVRHAVIDLIGPGAEAANARKLAEVLYETGNPNAYVFTETMETTRKDGSLIEGKMNFELRIRVNVPAVRQTLTANGIHRESADDATPGGMEQERQPDAIPRVAEAGEPEAAEPTVDPVSAEEERFIQRFVDTMTYMVYFAEDSAVDTEDAAFIMRSAVNQAGGYLVSDGRLVVDADQVERLKRDQELVYEEETGREISLLQWVARRLNADVYIELDARLSGSTRSGNHYGTAEITLSMYDTSTGQVLGSVNRRSQESFSRTSQQDAILNAVLSTVYQAMPAAVEMSRTQMARAVARGIRYELTIQNTPDGRAMSRFRTALRDEVKDVQSVSQSPEQTVYEVFAVGSTDDIVDVVYEVSERVAGFENLTLIMSRGRSLTFDAGY